jgi:hypothetical protein
MKHLFSFLGSMPSSGIFALIIVAALLSVLAFAASRVDRRRRSFPLANADESAVGTHEGAINLTLSATFSSRYLLAAFDGSVAGATTRAFAVVQDEGGSGDVVAAFPLGMGGRTAKAVAGGAITAGALINTLAGGKVDDTGTTGNYVVGRALTAAAADGDIIEFLPCFPYVIA